MTHQRVKYLSAEPGRSLGRSKEQTGGFNGVKRLSVDQQGLVESIGHIQREL